MIGLQKKRFRHIYIVNNMDDWETSKIDGYTPSSDLVLTFDLKLHKHIESISGFVNFFDHLVDTETMERNNFLIYDYFARWNLDNRPLAVTYMYHLV